MIGLSTHIQEAVAKRSTGKYGNDHYMHFGMKFGDVWDLFRDLGIENCTGALYYSGFLSRRNGNRPYYNTGSVGFGNTEMSIAFGGTEFYLRFDRKDRLEAISHEENDSEATDQDGILFELNSELEKLSGETAK